MKILLKTTLLLMSLFFSLAYAGGGITHMFIAQEAIARLPDPELRNLLQNNLDAYLVGAYYPDSGYINGAHYGEDSHWDPFVYTFADYLKEKYSQPALQAPKLVAFLFGCAAHRVSDEIIHWTFYNEVAKEDFKGNWEAAHQYGDPGIDLLLNIDKRQWIASPLNWWIPVNDLLEVYHRMGKDHYTAKEIEWGNSVIYLAGFGEKIISAPAYYYLKWKMPWTTKHYYDSPNGGILMNEEKVAEYQMKLWYRLKGISSPNQSSLNNEKAEENNTPMPTTDFAQNAILSGIVSIPAQSNADGSVLLQSPVITSMEKFGILLRELFSKIRENK